MTALKIDKSKKIHTRDIKIATFAYDDAHIIVEGELSDNKMIPHFSTAGEVLPPGNVHQLFIRMLIEIESVRIVQVEIEMPGTPHEECPGIIPNYTKLEGIRIARGFTSKVNKIIGGPEGCIHLTGLLMAMASGALQGLWTYKGKDGQKDEEVAERSKEYLADTCWVWRKDGPYIRRLLK